MPLAACAGPADLATASVAAANLPLAACTDTANMATASAIAAGVHLAMPPLACPSTAAASCETGTTPALASATSTAIGTGIAIAIAASTAGGTTATASTATGLAIAACIAAPAPPTCLSATSDQHRVAQAFISAAIRLAPALPQSAYRGRHRRTIAACPGARLQAVRP
ncbi:hypothetical protein [Catenulispora sp. MAP5-51]|uniref:hypothetical protein n=1 Tax=Catenulispora sp. MAP5-51 TaxID=3156298 RepID=UPI0035146490